MSGEIRLARAALGWGLAAMVPATALAYVLREAQGAISVAIAGGIVLANAALAAGLSALAGRASTAAAATVALPSFAVRMALIFAALSLLRGRAFIDQASFAVAFGLAVTLVMVAEARTWRRTPWIALTLKEKP